MSKKLKEQNQETINVHDIFKYQNKMQKRKEHKEWWSENWIALFGMIFAAIAAIAAIVGAVASVLSIVL